MSERELSDEEALALLYKRFTSVLASMPTCLDDYCPDLPRGYNSVWELIEQADRAAEKISPIGG